MNTSLSLEGLRSQLVEIANRYGLRGETSGRTKWLVLVAIALVWVSITLSLSSRVDAERTAIASLQSEIDLLSMLVNDDSWTQRFAESEAVRAQMETRLWTAATPGLAEASFEEWLRTRYQQHGIDVQQVLIARTPIDAATIGAPGLDGVEKLTAKIVSNFRPGGLINVTADIAEYGKSVFVDRLVIRTGRNSRLEADITTFFRLTP